MFSLCGGGDAEDEEARPEPEDPSESGYRPARMARELIDEAAMSPTGQVELPRGVARSNFTSSSARTHAALSAGSAALTFSASSAVGFGRGSAEGEAGAQAEILGEELKKEGNQLYNEGQLEAAELVYTEALKARGVSCARELRTHWGQQQLAIAYCHARCPTAHGTLLSQYSPKNHVIYSNRSMCYGKQGKYVVRSAWFPLRECSSH